MVGMMRMHWWMWLIRGIILVIFGVLAWLWPGLTVTSLVWVFGIYAVVDGIFAIVHGFSTDDDRWLWVLLGIAAIIAGFWFVVFPGLSAVALMVLIAAWWFVSGIFQIIAAIRLRKQIENEWLLGLLGLISVIAGLVFMIFPASGAISLIWVIGIYAIIIGIGEIIHAFRVRQLPANHAINPGV